MVLTSTMVNNGVVLATGGGTLEFENTGLVQNGASQVVSAKNKSTVILGSGSELSLGTLRAAGSGKVIVSGGTIDRMTLLGTIDVESGTLADDVVNKGTIDGGFTALPRHFVGRRRGRPAGRHHGQFPGVLRHQL